MPAGEPAFALSESALPSLLQNAWDHVFEETQIVLALAGSQIGLKPLPFHALAQFYPRYARPLDRALAG